MRRRFPDAEPDEPGPPPHCLPYVVAIFLIVLLMGLLLYLGTK